MPHIVLHVRLRYFSIIPLTIENFLLPCCKVCSVILPWSYAEQVEVGCTFETIFCCSRRNSRFSYFKLNLDSALCYSGPWKKCPLTCCQIMYNFPSILNFTSPKMFFNHKEDDSDSHIFSGRTNPSMRFITLTFCKSVSSCFWIKRRVPKPALKSVPSRNWLHFLGGLGKNSECPIPIHSYLKTSPYIILPRKVGGKGLFLQLQYTIAFLSFLRSQKDLLF